MGPHTADDGSLPLLLLGPGSLPLQLPPPTSGSPPKSLSSLVSIAGTAPPAPGLAAGPWRHETVSRVQESRTRAAG